MTWSSVALATSAATSVVAGHGVSEDKFVPVLSSVGAGTRGGCHVPFFLETLKEAPKVDIPAHTQIKDKGERKLSVTRRVNNIYIYIYKG